MTQVASERRGAAAILTLRGPGRANALSADLLAELRAGLSRATEDGAAAIVVRGEGETFGAGADLFELTGTSADVAIDAAVEATGEAIGACPVPVLAAIEGPCVGAAVDLALACDVRVASATAYFAVPAVALGILYNPAALARLARRVPRQTLARLLLLGERIGAEGAVAAGLAASVVPAGRALEGALALASRASDAVPAAGAATKELLAALDRGEPVGVEWEGVRLELLSAPERAASLRAARSRLTSRCQVTDFEEVNDGS